MDHDDELASGVLHGLAAVVELADCFGQRVRSLALGIRVEAVIQPAVGALDDSLGNPPWPGMGVPVGHFFGGGAWLGIGPALGVGPWSSGAGSPNVIPLAAWMALLRKES